MSHPKYRSCFSVVSFLFAFYCYLQIDQLIQSEISVFNNYHCFSFGNFVILLEHSMYSFYKCYQLTYANFFHDGICFQTEEVVKESFHVRYVQEYV